MKSGNPAAVQMFNAWIGRLFFNKFQLLCTGLCAPRCIFGSWHRDRAPMAQRASIMLEPIEFPFPSLF